MKAVVLALLATTVPVAHADPVVVSDGACPRYAIDIASFATCDGDRVAVADRATEAPALLPEAVVSVSKRTHSGLYVDAREAHRFKRDNAQRVVLVDVRSRLEAGLIGQPVSTDIHVPYLETALPLRWDEDLGGWAMEKNAAFAHDIVQRLQALGVATDRPLLLLCRSGERSARAADELAKLGYTQTISVVDGFEGDIAQDGRRSVNGWKNAGLPWMARPLPGMVYGARAAAR